MVTFKKLCPTAIVVVIIAAATFSSVVGWRYHNIAMAKVSVSAVSSVRTALFEYYADAGHFPPAVSQVNGYPHSWRTLVDNFLRERDKANSLQLVEPWNSEGNARVAQHSFSGFDLLFIPFRKKSVYPSSYFVVVGNETAFPLGGSTDLSDIRDGLENTILVIEVSGSKHPWSKPGDILFSNLKSIWRTLRGGQT